MPIKTGPLINKFLLKTFSRFILLYIYILPSTGHPLNIQTWFQSFFDILRSLLYYFTDIFQLHKKFQLDLKHHRHIAHCGLHKAADQYRAIFGEVRVCVCVRSLNWCMQLVGVVDAQRRV